MQKAYKATFRKAEKCYRRGKTTAAIANYKDCLPGANGKKEATDILTKLAELHLGSDLDMAEGYANRALDIFEAGDPHYQQSRFLAKRQLGIKLSRFRPREQRSLYVLRATIRFNQQKYEAALDDYNQALTFPNPLPVLYEEKAKALERLNLPTEASYARTEAARLHYYSAHSLMANRKWQHALEVLDTVLSMTEDEEITADTDKCRNMIFNLLTKIEVIDALLDETEKDEDDEEKRIWQDSDTSLKTEDLKLIIKAEPHGFTVSISAPDKEGLEEEALQDLHKKTLDDLNHNGTFTYTDERPWYEFRLETQGDQEERGITLIDFIDRAREYFIR